MELWSRWEEDGRGAPVHCTLPAGGFENAYRETRMKAASVAASVAVACLDQEDQAGLNDRQARELGMQMKDRSSPSSPLLLPTTPPFAPGGGGAGGAPPRPHLPATSSSGPTTSAEQQQQQQQQQEEQPAEAQPPLPLAGCPP